MVNPKKQVIQRKHRPDGFVIESRGDISYAEILRKMMGNLTLSDLGYKVERIRNQKGELFLELRKTYDEKTLNYIVELRW